VRSLRETEAQTLDKNVNMTQNHLFKLSGSNISAENYWNRPARIAGHKSIKGFASKQKEPCSSVRFVCGFTVTGPCVSATCRCRQQHGSLLVYKPTFELRKKTPSQIVHFLKLRKYSVSSIIDTTQEQHLDHRKNYDDNISRTPNRS
jgi:hypothetical protein